MTQSMLGVGKIVPVILSGGAGSRLWPASRKAEPKQMLALVTDETMIQETARRFDSEMYHPPVFVCNAGHEVMIRQQMAAIGVEAGGYLIEPEPRNTAAPAVVAALHALSIEEDALVLLVPADHHITRPEDFRRVVAACAPVAAQGRLMTFGITPDHAATGFGYIKKGEPIGPGAFAIEQFVEKPPLADAERYVASGEYAWNSGIFLFHAQTLIDEMMSYAPDVAEPSENAYEAARIDGDKVFLDPAIFATCESAPVDKAVMEKTQKGGVVPCSIGWHDIGSFRALHEIKAGDDGMAITGDVRLSETTNCLIETDGPTVAAVGVDNLAIIVRDGRVLVLNLDKAQNVKDIVTQIKTDGAHDLL